MGRIVQYIVFSAGGITALLFTRIHITNALRSSERAQTAKKGMV
jgi:hypothetical protein